MCIFEYKIHRPTSTSIGAKHQIEISCLNILLIPTLSAYYIARPTINIVCAVTAVMCRTIPSSARYPI